MDRITDPATIAEQLGVQHHFLPGLYAKEMHIPRGVRFGKHVHDYTHSSVLVKGSVVVRENLGKPGADVGVNTPYFAPACIVIKAGVEHEILALEDAIWYCIHPTDETDPSKIDEALTGARKD